MSPACHAWLRNKLHRWSDALGEKCVTCWPWCASNLLLCADHKELALICLPSPYRFSAIHLNCNMSQLSPIFHLGLGPVWLIKIGPDLDRRGRCVILPSVYESMCQGGPNMQISVATSVTWRYSAGSFLRPSCHNTERDEKTQHKGSTGEITRLWK